MWISGPKLSAREAADGEVKRATGEFGTEKLKSHEGAPETIDDMVGTRRSS